MKTEVLGIRYDNIKMNKAIAKAISLLDKKSNIFFLNIDYLYKAQKDQEYKKILNSADLVLSDGIGLKIVTKISGSKIWSSGYGKYLLAAAGGSGADGNSATAYRLPALLCGY